MRGGINDEVSVLRGAAEATEPWQKMSKHTRMWIARETEVQRLNNEAQRLQNELIQEGEKRSNGTDDFRIPDVMKRARAELVARQETQRLCAMRESDKLRHELLDFQRDGRRMLIVMRRVIAQRQRLPRRLSLKQPWLNRYRGSQVDVAEQLLHLDRLERNVWEVLGHEMNVVHRTPFRYFQCHESDAATPAVVDCEIQLVWPLPFSLDDVVNAVWSQTTRYPFKVT